MLPSPCRTQCIAKTDSTSIPDPKPSVVSLSPIARLEKEIHGGRVSDVHSHTLHALRAATFPRMPAAPRTLLPTVNELLERIQSHLEEYSMSTNRSRWRRVKNDVLKRDEDYAKALDMWDQLEIPPHTESNLQNDLSALGTVASELNAHDFL